MRTRIAVVIDDRKFASALVDLLRTAGHLVVEPEVADMIVMKVNMPRPGIRITEGRGAAQLTWFLTAPVNMRDVLAFVLRRAPAHGGAGSTSPMGR